MGTGDGNYRSLQPGGKEWGLGIASAGALVERWKGMLAQLKCENIVDGCAAIVIV